MRVELAVKILIQSAIAYDHRHKAQKHQVKLRRIVFSEIVFIPKQLFRRILRVVIADAEADLGFLPKFLRMVVGTFLIAWMLYEGLIRRFAITRLLFGMKDDG